MVCLNSINLVPLDYVAIVAIVVALLSAWYTYKSWQQALRANELSLLNDRKEIYSAFLEIRSQMLQKNKFASLEEVSKFYKPSRNAKFYFEDLAENISEYYDCCFYIADLARINTEKNSLDEEKNIASNLKREKELASTIEPKLCEIINKAIHNK